MLEAIASYSTPDGFRGTAGALLLSRNGERKTVFATQPDPDPEAILRIRSGRAGPRGPLPEGLPDGAGGFFSAEAVLEESARVLKLAGAWRSSLREAFRIGLGSPAVRLLILRNSAFPEWTPVELTEWRVGEPHLSEVRWPGAFYPSKAVVRPLLRALSRRFGIEPDPPFCTKPEPPSVLFADRDLVAAVKPSGLPSVPGLREGTSAKEMLEREFGPLQIVHRLDQGTSGIILFARTTEAERELGRMFREGIPAKRYEAVLDGVPEGSGGTVRLPLGRDLLDRPRQTVLGREAGGKASVTRWKLRGAACGRALVDLFPETGRTHQLRVHCAHPSGLSAPIEGDPLYGRRGLLELGRPRLMLHMAEISLPHPVTGRPLRFESGSGFALLGDAPEDHRVPRDSPA